MKNVLGTHEDLAFLKDRFKIATLPAVYGIVQKERKIPISLNPYSTEYFFEINTGDAVGLG